MKIYKKIVYDKDMNIIEEDSYEYKGPITECKGGGGGGGGIIGKVFKFVGSLVEGVVKIFTSPFGIDMTIPEVSAQQDEQIQGVLLNKDSGITNVPIVYGTRMVGGARVFVSTNGSGNEYLYVAYVLSEGQCDSYTQLLIDDIVVTPSSFAHGVEATVSESPYSDDNRLRVQFFDGRDDQVSSSLLQEAPGWTSDHRLRGLCYLAARFRWKKVETQEDSDNNPYGGGIPNVKVTLKGRKIFDLVSGYSRTDYGSFDDTDDEGFTIAADDTYAYKNIPISVTNGYRFTGDNNNDIDFVPARDDAEVKVTLRAVLSSNTNNYGQYNLGFQLFKDGVNYRPGDVPIGETGPTILKQSDGTITATFEKTITDLVTSSTWQFQPFLTVSSASGTISGTAEMTLEVKTPEYEDHAVAYGSETVSFNNNPANVLLDYMRNPRYGKGLDNEAFDWISFRRAALQCNQTVDYTATTTGKAFTCDAVVETSASIMNNCKILLVGFRGIMPYTQGKFRLKIENAGDDTDIANIPSDPPVEFTANDDNIVGGLRLVGDNKETKFNRCRVTYVDPDADYQPNEVIYPDDGSADDTFFLSQDNNQRFETTLSLPTVANREQALQYAEVFVKRSRNAKQIQFATTIASSNISVGDLCRVVSNNIGLDGVFRITDIRLNAEGDIQVTGFEHQPTVYTINAKAADITRPTLNLPDPLLVPAPTNVSVTSSTTTSSGYVAEARLDVTWTATTDPFIKEYIVQYKLVSDTDYITAGITNDTEFFIDPVASGEQYNVRVAARNELNKRSDYANASPHTVS
jgi:hypothetical protein